MPLGGFNVGKDRPYMPTDEKSLRELNSGAMYVQPSGAEEERHFVYVNWNP